MSFFSDDTGMRDRFLAIILWGCLEGFLFAAVCFFLQKTEGIVTISCYSGAISPVYPFWKFGTLVLLSFTLGMVTAARFCTGKRSGIGPVRAGLAAGTSATLIAIIMVEVYPLGLSWIDNPIVIAGPCIVILGVYLLISVIPQVLGAWYQGSHQGSQESCTNTSQAIISSKYRHGFFFASSLVILLVLPLCLLALPMDTTDYFACPGGTTCQPGDQCGSGRPPDNVTIARTSPDSIRVSLKAGSSKCGSHNSFRILLNGNDISNQALIAKTGLDLTITPSEGLGPQDGSFVIVQGQDVYVNETTPSHIQIVITDRSTTWIHRDQVL